MTIGPARRVRVAAGFVITLTAAMIAVIYYWNIPTATPPQGHRRNQTKAAEKALERLQDRYTAMRQHKQYDSIIAMTRQHLDRHADHAPSHNFLFMVLSEAGRLHEAYDQVLLSLKLAPGQGEIHFSAGVLATKLNRLEAALAHYQQAVSIDRDRAIYRVHQAMVHIKIQQHEQARMLLLQALQLDSNLADAYFGLADLYFMQNNLPMALELIDKAVARTPVTKREKQVKYILHKSRILRRSNRWADALAAVNQLTLAERTDPPVIEQMAICFNNLGRPADGALLFEHALAANPATWRYAAGAAKWRLEAGNLDLARQHLGTLRYLNPRAPQLTELQEKLDRAARPT